MLTFITNELILSTNYEVENTANQGLSAVLLISNLKLLKANWFFHKNKIGDFNFELVLQFRAACGNWYFPASSSVKAQFY